jgi:hypothetical protein
VYYQDGLVLLLLLLMLLHLVGEKPFDAHEAKGFVVLWVVLMRLRLLRRVDYVWSMIWCNAMPMGAEQPSLACSRLPNVVGSREAVAGCDVWANMLPAGNSCLTSCRCCTRDSEDLGDCEGKQGRVGPEEADNKAWLGRVGE